MATSVRKLRFSSVIVNVCKDFCKPAWSRQHSCFKDGSCWYFSTSVTTDLMYLGSGFFSSAPFRSGGRTQTCEHRSTRTTLLVSHSGFIWANIWLACSKWPFVVRNNTRAAQRCTSFNPFCRSSNGLPARMICRMLRDRTRETSVVAWQHLESRGLCLCLCSGERDLGFRGTHRVFKLSTDPSDLHAQSSRAALNRATRLAGGKAKRLFKPTQTASTVPPSTALVCLCDLPFNTGNIIFDQSGKFDMVKKRETVTSSITAVTLHRPWGPGGLPWVTGCWAEICSTQQGRLSVEFLFSGMIFWTDQGL